MESPRQHELVKPSGTYPEPWLLPRSGRLLYRALLGRPMDNHIRTDSTFWHRAQTGYPSPWLRLAGWERAVVRVLGAWVLFMVLVVLLAWVLRSGTRVLGFEVPWVLQVLEWRTVLEVHAIGVLMILVPVGIRTRVRDHGVRVRVPVMEVSRSRVHVSGWVTYEVPGRKAWELEKVRPVAAVAANILALSYRPENVNRWVRVPRTYRDHEGAPVEVMLPSNFTGADEGHKRRLVTAVGARLGMRDPIVEWDLLGSQPRLLLKTPPAPPEKVTYADIERWLQESEEYRPVLGFTGPKTILNAEMQGDSPHIALSAGPGAGKSTLAKFVIMQALRWGWGVVILDWKMTEAYEWAKGLQGVTYITDIEDIHDMGERLGQEVDIRKKAKLAGRAKVLVIRDEWNVTAELLLAYWTARRAQLEPEERRVTPVKSPALAGFAKLDFGGREFGLHDFVITQRLSARAFNGNADIRECFGIRCMARYSMQTKVMLVGNMKPFPKNSNHPGRWTIVTGADVAVVQVPLVTGEEAREYAMGGQENPLTPFSSEYYPAVAQRPNEAPALEDPLGHDPASDLAGSEEMEALEATEVQPSELRKLSEMVDGLAHLGITLNILQKASKTFEHGFPTPLGGTPNRGYTYDYQQVKEWAMRRHAARQAERTGK